MEGSDATEFTMSRQFGNAVNPAMPPNPAAAEFPMHGQFGNVVNPAMLPNPAAAEIAMHGQFGNVLNPAMHPPPAAAEITMLGQFGNMVNPAMPPPPAAADVAVAAPEVNYVAEVPTAAVAPVGAVVGSGQASQAGGVNSTGGKKKRGRPRKNESRENSRTPTRTPGSGHPSSSRVRTPVSGNWQLLSPLSEDMFMRSAFADFTTQNIEVNPGEDVVRKITSTVFADNFSRGFCVLSASGTVSRVAISQPGNSGNLLTYEGRFDLTTLSGSISVADGSGGGSRSGGFGVSVAGSDGRLIGGRLAGRLIAAGPISITVASFQAPGYKNKLTLRRNQNRRGPSVPATASPIAPPGSSTGTVAPIHEANTYQGYVLASAATASPIAPPGSSAGTVAPIPEANTNQGYVLASPATVSPIAPPGSATGTVAPIPKANTNQGYVLASPATAGPIAPPGSATGTFAPIPEVNTNQGYVLASVATASPVAPLGSTTGTVAPFPEANPNQGYVSASLVQAGNVQQPNFIPTDKEVTGIDDVAMGRLNDLANIVAGSWTHNVPDDGAGPSEPPAM